MPTPSTIANADAQRDPVHHTQKVRESLRLLADHLREDVEKVADPKAQALFETSAEVLDGLIKAFRHYEDNSESAWQ
jgi:hypothetical protein